MAGVKIDELDLGAEYKLGTNISFSFLSSVPSYYAEGSHEAAPERTFQAFTAAQQAAAIEIMSQIEAVTNITFTEAPAGEVGTVTFGVMDPPVPEAAGWVTTELGAEDQADVWMSSTFYDDGGAGVAFRETLIHEIGHALGLNHPFDDSDILSGHVDPGPNFVGIEDSEKYTMMSYDRHPAFLSPAGKLMLYDIAMLQHLYGANTTTNVTDDLYSDWNLAALEIHSIWDANGIDTISAESATMLGVRSCFVRENIRLNLNTVIGQFAGRLKPEEWRSGKNHVIVDFVSPFITDEDEKKRMLASVFGAKKKEGAE